MCTMYGRCSLVMSLSVYFFFFKQKTAYEMRISDWSSDVCSSDLAQVEKLSFSGLRAVSPAVFMAWNMGLSFSFSLIHSEMPSSRSENRKGIRQPQLSH